MGEKRIKLTYGTSAAPLRWFCYLRISHIEQTIPKAFNVSDAKTDTFQYFCFVIATFHITIAVSSDTSVNDWMIPLANRVETTIKSLNISSHYKLFPFPELCNKRIGILYFEQLKKALFDVISKAQFIGNREHILQLRLREERKQLNEIKIDEKICGRYYQMEAIRAVCDRVMLGFRKNLLVMATGTRKNRTAAALTDVLSRGGYLTNVLFLADRKALVK